MSDFGEMLHDNGLSQTTISKEPSGSDSGQKDDNVELLKLKAIVAEQSNTIQQLKRSQSTIDQCIGEAYRWLLLFFSIHMIFYLIQHRRIGSIKGSHVPITGSAPCFFKLILWYVKVAFSIIRWQSLTMASGDVASNHEQTALIEEYVGELFIYNRFCNAELLLTYVIHLTKKKRTLNLVSASTANLIL